MSRTYRGEARRRLAREMRTEEFRCRHCHLLVGPPTSGGRHRNHCPYCLYSRHVDSKTPGDRASRCRSLMAPVGTFARRGGEDVLVHRCLGCGFERYCRIAADDAYQLVIELAHVDPARFGLGAPARSRPGDRRIA